MATTSDDAALWPTEWLRGALSVCVLHVIAAGPTYGYAIASALTDAGLGAVKGGTLYPLLSRLEEAGLVTIEWRAGEGGPGRKFYALTEAGRSEHDRLTTDWRAFAALTSSFIDIPALAPTHGKDPS